ncbi:MAG: S8 family peptidase [Flavobacteriales bacterium]
MKYLKNYLLFTLFIFLVSCTQDQILDDSISKNLEKAQEQKLLSKTEINKIIESSLKNTGNFNWKQVTDQVLWSAVVHGNNVLTIGYGQKGEHFRSSENQRLLQTKNNIIQQVYEIEDDGKFKINLRAHKTLNTIDISVNKIETITELRKRNDIRYLEPNGYTFFTDSGYPQNQKSSSGCGFDGETLNQNDYKRIRPNALRSWTIFNPRIHKAWNTTTGQGVTVGLIDTGISEYQPLLGSNFNDGYSNGRSIEKYGTFVDSIWPWSDNYDGPNDKCGHGTSMASTLAAPRNDDFLPVGVAYNCNLVSYRATEDVLLNDYHEKRGVTEALVALADRPDVKIISMSVGYPWSIGNVEDAVIYAYNQGKLIFAAGGTSLESTNWYPVIFPANMNECIAVTGITDYNGYQQCDTCHTGSEIEFTVTMERENDNNRTGTVLGFYEGETNYVGGSSVATATVAGIATLVWSKFPNLTREEVLNKMRQASHFYPNKDSDYGYGNIQAFHAVQ